MADAATQPVIKVAPPPRELERQPLIANQRNLGWISDRVAGVAEGKTPKWWWYAFIPSVLLMFTCFAMVLYLMSTGVELTQHFVCPMCTPTRASLL